MPPVQHAIFHIERSFTAAPRRVFQAFADREAKARWFAAPRERWQLLERVLDFRVGGRERLRGKWTNGTESTFDAVCHDIIPDQRIIYTYNMFLDARKISVSLATIEIRSASGGGTDLKVTEQGAYLDGYEDGGSREQGTGSLLDALGASLG